MVHMKILEKCGGELEHALRRRCMEPCSTGEYMNALKDILKRTKVGRTWKKLAIKIQVSHLSKKINQKNISSAIHPIVMSKENATNLEDHNDEEEESDSEKDTEDSETSEIDEFNRINSQIKDIDLMYEVLDVNSNLQQVGTSDTNLTNIQDAKLYRTKPAKGMGYTVEKSSISIFMVVNQEAKVNLDTGAHCTCVGERYLETIVPVWEEKLIPIQGIKFGSSSESINPLRVIYLTLILPHTSQCIRLKVAFVVMDNCTSNHSILGNDYLSIYGIDISNQKD
ncbi:hypothetical protein O181_083218 [Austropuccinia psidii MF-1]|uniref:Uncharacterized protein n=1 Tax=Austropuccinia psidii MF-1 TaxID=1389203 RepID=A0A9Q3IJC3_9BASI|nr:hypothetical protein [Austropuccinia psidii MF-1]